MYVYIYIYIHVYIYMHTYIHISPITVLHVLLKARTRRTDTLPLSNAVALLATRQWSPNDFSSREQTGRSMTGYCILLLKVLYY